MLKKEQAPRRVRIKVLNTNCNLKYKLKKQLAQRTRGGKESRIFKEIVEFQIEWGLKGEDSGPGVARATPSVFWLLQKPQKVTSVITIDLDIIPCS